MDTTTRSKRRPVRPRCACALISVCVLAHRLAMGNATAAMGNATAATTSNPIDPAVVSVTTTSDGSAGIVVNSGDVSEVATCAADTATKGPARTGGVHVYFLEPLELV